MMIPELIGVKVLPGGRNTSDWYQSINFILFHTVENVIPLDEHITVSITIHSIIFSLLDAYYRLKSIARHGCNSLKKIILFIFWWNPFGVTPSVWDDNKSERLARAVKDIRGGAELTQCTGKERTTPGVLVESYGGDFVFPGRVGDASFWCCKRVAEAFLRAKVIKSWFSGKSQYPYRTEYFVRCSTPRFYNNQKIHLLHWPTFFMAVFFGELIELHTE